MALLRRKRIFIVLLVFVFLMFIYTMRIVWIQLTSSFKVSPVSGMTVNEIAVRQREEGIELDSGRGHFVDRHGMPLTGKTVWVPVFFPVRELPDDEVLKSLAEWLEVSESELVETWRDLRTPYIWRKRGSNDLYAVHPEVVTKWSHVQGLRVLPYMQRYLEHNSGKQWLGYTSQQPDFVRQLQKNFPKRHLPLTMRVGASGLERTFDSFLRGIGPTRAAYVVDGKKRPIYEQGIRLTSKHNHYYPLYIHTTIDLVIQEKLERLAEEMKIEEGAIVVLDAATADVVAMVSIPFFNPNHIDLKRGNWANHAMKAIPPGSIFKTIVAAAALEEKVADPNEVFQCTGEYGKYGLSCWKVGGHGQITFREGFAHSCNIVFASLAERLTVESIQSTALKLGLGRNIGWAENDFEGRLFRQFDQEEAGKIFALEDLESRKVKDGHRIGLLAQTGLGQRNVLTSPLQAANLIVTLLSGGNVKTPRIVSKISFRNGSILQEFPVKDGLSSLGSISPATSRTLLKWMEDVVKIGTGQSLRMEKWQLAGKSGTAQAVYKGRNVNHQWFIGYGPTDKPGFAVAVLVKNRPTHSTHQATDLFRGVMEVLAANE